MERRKEYTYWWGTNAETKAWKLLDFARGNLGLKDLLSSTIDLCDPRVNKAGMRMTKGDPVIPERLRHLRWLANGGFRNYVVHNNLTRKLDSGIGITLAFINPDGLPTIKQLRALSVKSVHLDLAFHEAPPFNQDPFKDYGQSGFYLLAAIGLTEINKWGKIINEDLDGVRLFLNQEGRCFGSEIKFTDQNLTLSQGVVSFDESYQPEIDTFKAGLNKLSFLP